MDKKYYQQLGTIFKALNHPVRLAILDVLRVEEACVCHLESVLGQRQAYISQQLAVLREAGMIEDRRDGWNVYYQVRDPKIFEIIDLARQSSHLKMAPDFSNAAGRCSCPKCEARKQGQTVEAENKITNMK